MILLLSEERLIPKKLHKHTLSLSLSIYIYIYNMLYIFYKFDIRLDSIRRDYVFINLVLAYCNGASELTIIHKFANL